MMSNQTSNLRKQLKQQRKNISSFQQARSESQILSFLIRYPKFQHSNKIGIYLHAFGEIHTKKIIEYCFKMNKLVYLPMICIMNQHLVWVKISQHQFRNKKFSMHHLSMLEPKSSRGFDVSTLDLLIMPLLACDQNGTRMGMGGGYYDRTLASAPHHPYRLGIAHDFQILEQPLLKQKWDQPLDALITPSNHYHFKRQSSQ